MPRVSNISAFLVTLIVTLSIAYSEASLMAGDRRTFHLLVSVLAVMLATFSGAALLFEVRGTRGYEFKSTVANAVVAVSLVWWMYFMIFLCLAVVGALIGGLASLLKGGSTASFEMMIPLARKIGAACVFASPVPPIIMSIAIKLGFKPHGHTYRPIWTPPQRQRSDRLGAG